MAAIVAVMGNSEKVRPSRAWFIVPSVFLLAAFVLGGVAIASFVGFVRADFRPYQPGSSISVTQDGFTLYAEEGTPGLSYVRCTATGPRTQTRLDHLRTRSTQTNSHGSFVAFASTPADLPAGNYVIECQSDSARSDFPIYVGARVNLEAVGRLILIGIVAPLFLGLCSVVLFIVLGVMRYRSRRASTAASAQHYPPPAG